jgi:DNA-binding CsgD family transcriptional regulator
MAWGRAVRIELNDAERTDLEARMRRRKVAHADAMRAEIVLLAASGMTNLGIAERLGITRVTVTSWRTRFAAKRLDGLLDEPRPGAPRKIGDEKIADVATATHWSTRSMLETRIQSRSAGPRPPMTSWHPSNGSAAEPPTSRVNVHRN